MNKTVAMWLTIGSVLVTVLLVVGWIVQVAIGKHPDTEYVALTTLTLGHTIGVNTGVNLPPTP